MSVANSIQQQSIPEIQSADCDGFDALRQIISKQGKRNISSDVAIEIGNSLIEFFEILADEGEIDCGADD